MTPYESRSGGLGMMLSLVGVAVVGVFVFQQFLTGSTEPWVFVLGLVSALIWLGGQLGGQLGRDSRWESSPGLRVAAGIASVIMIATGALGAAPSNGLLVVPASIGVMRLASTLSARIWIGVAAMLLAIALIAVGSFTVTMSPLGLLAIMGGVVLGFLGGLNRRQARQAAVRERELVERTMAAREEHAKAAALGAQQAVARDIHDVLAHSLGGLVIQLDAVEALLESGRTADAASRVRDARGLAASGLGEARRAVDALREPRDDASVAGDDVARSLAELVDAHRGLGGVAELVERGEPAELAADEAVAVRRALQESLSNARKHAPGSPVQVTLDWTQHGVVLEVRNRLTAAAAVELPAQRSNAQTSRSHATDTPKGGAAPRVFDMSDGVSRGSVVPGVPAPLAPSALAASGGGHGLAGMAERFDALQGGSVSAGAQGNEFVVRADVVTGVAR